MGVLGAFTTQVGDLLTKGLTFEVYRPGTGGKGLAVVLGIWRPSPISAEYFGYSDDPAARKLELRAFLLTQRLTGKIIDDDAEVETMIGVHPPAPDLLRWVAGVDVLPRIAFVGMGALGSAIFSNLLRSGLDDVTVLDDDILQSHDLARHTGGTRDLFKPKIDHAERLATDVVRDGVTVTPVRGDVT